MPACIFRKRRNVYRAIVVPEELSRSQARALQKKIIEQAAKVFPAPTRNQAISLIADFQSPGAFGCRKPRLVRTGYPVKRVNPPAYTIAP